MHYRSPLFLFSYRDRVSSVWQGIRDHLYSLIVAPEEYSLLVERAVVGLLRLAIRLLRREDVALQVRAFLLFCVI